MGVYIYGRVYEGGIGWTRQRAGSDDSSVSGGRCSWKSWTRYLLAAFVISGGVASRGWGAEKALHWPFENSLEDHSDSGNHGVFLGSGDPVYVPGRFGRALRLGAEDTVISTSGANIPTGVKASWSFNLWARFESNQPIGAVLGGFGARTDTTGDKRYLIHYNGAVYFWGGLEDIDAKSPLSADGKWHMYTVTFDAGQEQLRVYLDGAIIAFIKPLELAVADGVASVGGRPEFFGGPFTGEIDEFSIWVGTLTDKQILALFESNSVVVPPPWWSRWWFVSLISLILGSGVTIAYRVRERRRQETQILRLEQESSVERERSRIARDIHDDLGAGLTRVTLLSEMAVEELKDHSNAKEFAAEIAATARDLTGTLDEIVWAVDPKNDTVEGFLTYSCRYAQEFLGFANIRCRLDVPPSLPELGLATEVRHHLLLALKEILNNLVKHAEASECVLHISLQGQRLRLVVEDNGMGIEASRLEESTSGGHGLQNVRDRLRAVGGECVFEPNQPHGTRVILTVPLPRSARSDLRIEKA